METIYGINCVHLIMRCDNGCAARRHASDAWLGSAAEAQLSARCLSLGLRPGVWPVEFAVWPVMIFLGDGGGGGSVPG